MLDKQDIKKLTEVLATKKDLKDETEGLARMMKNSFDYVDKRFNGMDKRFDKIEDVLIRQHDEKLAELERRIRQLEDALAV
jgi:BMFP domain-containing protein YqiC